MLRFTRRIGNVDARFIPLSFVVATGAWLISCHSSHANIQIVERWLATNGGTQTLAVDFTQSRSLKALKNPIIQTCKMWLDYRSHQFRWQLGDPTKTIVASRGPQKKLR